MMLLLVIIVTVTHFTISANAQCIPIITTPTPCIGGLCGGGSVCCTGPANTTACCPGTSTATACASSTTTALATTSAPTAVGGCSAGQSQVSSSSGSNCLSPAICPTGSACIFSYVVYNYICCTITLITPSLCPNAVAQAYATTPNLTAIRTSCLSPYICPTAQNYHCTYSIAALNYLCCQTSTAVTTATNCANGLAQGTATFGSLTSNTCTAPFICTTNYKCTYTASVNNYLCCLISG